MTPICPCGSGVEQKSLIHDRGPFDARSITGSQSAYFLHRLPILCKIHTYCNINGTTMKAYDDWPVLATKQLLWIICYYRSIQYDLCIMLDNGPVMFHLHAEIAKLRSCWDWRVQPIRTVLWHYTYWRQHPRGLFCPAILLRSTSL